MDRWVNAFSTMEISMQVLGKMIKWILHFRQKNSAKMPYISHKMECIDILVSLKNH